MKDALLALVSSRKFWTGTVSVMAVFGAVLLCALKIIPESSLIPTISAITATALGFMGTTAWEDTSKTKANSVQPPASAASVNVTNVSQPK